MPAIDQMFRLELFVLVGGLFGIVSIQLLTGKINTEGLFYGVRRDGSRYFSPERVQLLFITLAFGFYYLIQVFETHATEFPPVEKSWIAITGGSHALYLGRKLYSLVVSRLKAAA